MLPSLSSPARRRLERGLESLVLIAALATIPLLLASEEDFPAQLIATGDWLIWTIFSIEFVAMLTLSRDRPRYLRHSWLNLAVIVVSFPVLPDLFGLARLVRLARLLLVMARGVEALGRVLGRKGLTYVASTTAFLIVSGGALMALIEPETVKGGFWDGVWWAAVTASTVGYGDISPTSTPGRLLAVALMVAGIGLTSTLAATMAAYFVEGDDAEQRQATTDRLVRIENRLDELVQRNSDTAPSDDSTLAGSREDPRA